MATLFSGYQTYSQQRAQAEAQRQAALAASISTAQQKAADQQRAAEEARRLEAQRKAEEQMATLSAQIEAQNKADAEARARAAKYNEAFYSGAAPEDAADLAEYNSPSTTVGQYYRMMQETQRAAAEQEARLRDVQSQREQVAAQYGQREQELTKYLEGLGQSERDNLARQKEALLARQKQDMINRGVMSTSTYDTAARGVERGYNQDMATLSEMLQKQQMDYRTALSADTLAAQGAVAEGAGQTASDIFSAYLKPIEVRGALAGYRGEMDTTRAAQEASKMKAQFDAQSAMGQLGLGYAQLGSEESIRSQELALQRLGLQQETALGYAKLANDLKTTKMSTALQQQQAAAMSTAMQAAKNNARGIQSRYINPEGFLYNSMRKLVS